MLPCRRDCVRVLEIFPFRLRHVAHSLLPPLLAIFRLRFIAMRGVHPQCRVHPQQRNAARRGH